MQHPSPLVLALSLLSACLVDSGPPDLGSCAEDAAPGASYGEIGIGSCLAGPVDMDFVDDGTTQWLVVANANPNESFETGSVLAIDWNSIDFTKERNELGDLTTGAIALNALVGGLGIIERDDARLVLVSDRLSEGTITQFEDDRALVVDLSDPLSPSFWEPGSVVELREDPGPIAVAADQQIAFVANLNDESLSVVDTASTPLEVMRLGGSADVTSSRLFDIDGSGTRALSQTLVSSSSLVPDEQWTLSWIGGSNRLFVPASNGLQRLSGGEGVYRQGAFGIELDPLDPAAPHDSVLDPSFSGGNASELYFSDDGVIWSSLLGSSAEWVQTGVRFAGSSDWDAVVGGPHQVELGTSSLLYYDGRTPSDTGSDIGVALRTVAGSWAGSETPVVERGDFDAVSDPWVVQDPFARTIRMWMTAEVDGETAIATSVSDDGLSWSEPVVVTETGLAAPTVRYQNGRYRMVASQLSEGGYLPVELLSVDGVDWSEPAVIDATLVTDSPTRTAVQSQTTGAWRIAGASFGEVTEPVVAGGITLIDSVGLGFRVSHGHTITPSDLATDVVNLWPVSKVTAGGLERLYLTIQRTDASLSTALFEHDGTRWTPVATDLVPGSNAQGLVVVPDGTGWRAFYARDNGEGRTAFATATSTDGITFTEVATSGTDVLAFNATQAVPHSATPLDGGGWRVWYSGFDGSRWRIGSTTTPDGTTFTNEPGDGTEFQLGIGQPGTLDDAGVRDPVTAVIDGVEHLWYGGSPNGSEWQILHASRPEGTQAWTRDADTTPILFGLSRTYSVAGVRSPVVEVDEDGRLSVLHAGTDTIAWRVGRAIGSPTEWFPAQNVPTREDRVVFSSVAGGTDADVIGLNQVLDGFVTTGVGISSLTYDEPNGRLFVTQRRGGQPGNYIQVIDVRDDSEGSFIDRNAFDLEAVVVLDEDLTSAGIRDLVLLPDAERLYATASNPDSVVAVDIRALEDNDVKDVLNNGLIGSLPLLRIGTPDVGRPFADEDAGVQTGAPIAGAGLALAPDGKTLLVAHFRDNSVVVIDTSLGAWGEEIRRIPNVGENPHAIRISPDGRYAVVANYLGEVDDETVVNSTLAVVDIQPDSPTYLEVVTWLVNR